MYLYKCLINLLQGWMFSRFIHHQLSGKTNEKIFFYFSIALTSLCISTDIFFPASSRIPWYSIPLFLYAFCFFQESFSEKILCLLMIIAINTGIEGILCHLNLQMIDPAFKIILLSDYPRVTLPLLKTSVLWIFLSLTSRFFQFQQTKPLLKHLMIPIILTGILLTDILFLFFDKHLIPSKWLFMAGLFLLAFVSLLLYLSHALSVDFFRAEHYHIRETLLKNQNEQIQDLQAMYTQILRTQHDIHAYIRDHESAFESSSPELQEFPKRLADSLPQLPHTGNSVLNSIIAVKSAKMEKHHIEFQSLGLHYTGGLAITDSALGSLLSNMLDNAIEAVSMAADKLEHLYIYLNFTYTSDGLLIICENPIEENPKRSSRHFFSSTKAEPGHGLGLTIMQKIIEDSAGQIDFIIGKNTFQVTAQIPYKKES